MTMLSGAASGPVTRMTDSDFRLFSDFVYRQCGVNLPLAKKTMLISRLSKRLRILGMDSFKEYYQYVTSPQGQQQELIDMINAITTNKTDFFREPKHFDFLFHTALPELKRIGQINPPQRLNIWSAGCSTGEEPYTLSMVLAEYFSQNPGDFLIHATDISTRVLSIAQSATYPQEAIEPIPEPLKRKYLLRGKDSKLGYFRVIKDLRKRIGFSRLNLNEGSQFNIHLKMNIIFCRNVIIYFDRPTQIGLFEKFYNQLTPGGYMFIGHSETLHGINDKFVPVATSVYRKPQD